VGVEGGGVEALFWLAPITAGDFASWRSPGVLVDSGGTSGGVGWTLPPPANSTSLGVQGDISYDSFGNFYVAYGTNEWAKFEGLTVWSTTTAWVFDFSNYTTYSQYIPLLVGFG
jgi:hypothetical protein